MKISYKKLWVMLIEREIPKAVFRKETELSPGTMSKLNKNEEVALSVLLRIVATSPSRTMRQPAGNLSRSTVSNRSWYSSSACCSKLSFIALVAL